MNFDTAFDRLTNPLNGSEGGYVNNPADPGGETKWGISKRSYPNLDIRGLTREEARFIYRRDFWDAGNMDQFDGAIAFQVFDAAVNHGIRRAFKLLQSAVGAVQDGAIGPDTVAAVQEKLVTDTLALFVAARLEFWTDCPNWPNAGRGWTKRAALDIRYAVVDFNSGRAQ